MDDHDELQGTMRMFDESGNAIQSEVGIKKHGDIVLVPQPTDSPNDPLHWSLPRKYWHATLVCFVTALTAATSNDAGASQYGQNTDLNISYDTMNIGAGVLFIGIGYWTLLISPSPYLYGRRISYLICILLGLVGAIWLARVQTSEDSVWNQLFVGASEAVAEANVQLSLFDIFFQHQRGAVLGMYVLATSVGTYLGPLIASYIADSSQGWRWIGWWSVIISGITLVVLYFGLEETAFDREAYVQSHSIDGITKPQSTQKDDAPSVQEKGIDKYSGDDTSGNAMSQPPAANPEIEQSPETYKSYRDRIRIITPAPNIRGYGFKQYGKRLFHTLRVFSFPAVLYSGLQWGAQDAWLTFYLTVEEDNWYGPPWNYSDAADGVMNVPCLIGAVIGCVYGGYLSDVFVRWMARRNGGIFEAEYRLWLMFPCAIFSPVGLWLFGIGSNDGWSWPVPYVGLGFIGFGWGCAGDLSMAYLMDAYPNMVLEGMVGVAVINNTIGMTFTFATSYWLDASGIQNTFIAIGVLSFAFIMTTVPMMIFGKRARRWTKKRYERFVMIRDGHL